MSGGMIKKQRRAKIKQQLKEQKAAKVTNELKDGFVNMSEEEQDELAQAIADIAMEKNSENEEEQFTILVNYNIIRLWEKI